jgi:trans-aconitate methyltransferase
VFYATGEADVAGIVDRIGGGQPPSAVHSSALDFGCGVGRLTKALAKRYTRVVGVDISPTMLRLARDNVPSATFSEDLPDETFDLIVSLIVLQHVEVERGMELLRQLVKRLNKDGLLVLQVPVGRKGGVIKRLARRLRAGSPLVHRVTSAIRREKHRLPYMQMNAYDLSSIRREIVAAGCVVTSVESAAHADIVSVTLIARKL